MGDHTRERIDALTTALTGLNPRMDAVAKLCAAAIELVDEGRTMTLGIHALSRDAFDSFEGVEMHYPIVEGEAARSHEWWHRKVVFYDETPGAIAVDLYTVEPPRQHSVRVDQPQDEDGGEVDHAGMGEHDWRL